MAYSDLTSLFRVQEGQDATQFRVWDKSTWNGESGYTTSCILTLFHYAVDGTITQYDEYPLIIGLDATKFNEYLSDDGHIVDIADLTINGESAGERFEDGYYVVRITYSDGTAGTEPYYDNVQAFLAKARCKSRKLPGKLVWPLSEESRQSNWDIFLLRMYLDAAEDSADLGKENEFRNIMNLINNIFSYYAIDECF